VVFAIWIFPEIYVAPFDTAGWLVIALALRVVFAPLRTLGQAVLATGHSAHFAMVTSVGNLAMLVVIAALMAFWSFEAALLAFVLVPVPIAIGMLSHPSAAGALPARALVAGTVGLAAAVVPAVLWAVGVFEAMSPGAG
jgi:hypothetical protein